MRLITTVLILSCSIGQPLSGAAHRTWPGDSLTEVNRFILDATCAFERLNQEYVDKIRPLSERHREIYRLLKMPVSGGASIGYPLLREYTLLQADIRRLEEEHQLKKLKLRYRKGLEIIKMLYEKILGMDHHFSSLKTQHELMNISNPHHYEAFKDAQGILKERIKKKYGFQAPNLLLQNPFLSATFSVVGLVLGGADNKMHKKDLDQALCVMDLTVRIFNDLNIIYYETGYLKDANLNLKKECENLFTECARQIGYTIPLEHCRNSDDWERVYTLLDNEVNKVLNITVGQAGSPMPADPKTFTQIEGNLLFAIDRMLLFIQRYTDFVRQGSDYYQKFAKITANYENETACSAVLTEPFIQLKTDINLTLDKFNTAYKMPEVQGSKLKDMLYGFDSN
jgi:hypothetical protein